MRLLRGASLGDVTELRYALDAGGNPNEVLFYGRTSALENAAGQFANAECVRLLMRAGARLPGDGGLSLVAGCIQAGKVDVAAALLEGGARVVDHADVQAARVSSAAELHVAAASPLGLAIQVR
jgi:hypothetical protein